MNPENSSITGSVVVDCHGSRVGKATDVLFDDYTMQPTWVVVDYGTVLKHRTAVPYDRIYVGETGEIVLESDKDTVKEAPRVHGAPLSTDESTALERYYHGSGSPV
jgi:sporulation protein YlmC with PRC-barrel domain